MEKEKRSIPVEAFTFLGFKFKARRAITKRGVVFSRFLPAISEKAVKKAGDKIREMDIRNSIQLNLKEISEEVNQYVRGFIEYYGKFYKSATYKILKRIDWMITEWVRKKYRKTKKEVYKWLRRIYKTERKTFEHWKYITPSYAQRVKEQ